MTWIRTCASKGPTRVSPSSSDGGSPELAAPLVGVLLGDTHGHLDARIAARVAEADFAVHTGDVGHADILDALKPRRRLAVIQGNNDPGSDAGGPWSDIPRQATLSLPGGDLAVVHGDAWPARNRHQRLRAAFPAAKAVVYGHSHRLAIDDAALPWVLNPGAAGRTRTYGGPSCLVLNIPDSATWQIEPLRFPRA